MKKNLANYFTISRMILSIILLFFLNDKPVFLIIFSIAFITDAIDGRVARATKTQSDLGSKLDDIADTMLGAVMGIAIFVWLGMELLVYLGFASILIAIRLFNVYYTKQKFGKVYVIHTYGNKLTSFIAYLIPITFILFDTYAFFYIVIIVGTLASLEECIIHLKSDDFSHSRKSLFFTIDEDKKIRKANFKS